MKICCEKYSNFLNEGKVSIYYSPKFREYGIMLVDSNNSYQKISYCPWCGAKFSSSLRDKWFDELEHLIGEDFDPINNEKMIPLEYMSDVWWKKNKDKGGGG